MTWLYRKSITISHTQNQDTQDLLNFPLLVLVTDPLLKSRANGGLVFNANGYDIIFTDQYNVQLDHEIERYTAATGEIEMWVRIPTFSKTLDTLLYIYFGNSAISSSQANPTAVWDGNYKAIWHLPNGTTLSLADSTTDANTGTNSGATAVAAQIDGGASFNGSSNFISFPTTGFPTGAGAFSFGFWFFLFGADQNNVLLDYGTRLANEDITLYIDGAAKFNAGFDAGGNVVGPIPTTNAWHYAVATYDGTTLILYIDGVSQGSVATTGNLVNTSCVVGALIGGASNFFSGALDEVHVSAGASGGATRSAGWTLTEYNNQFSPGTFFTLGPLQGLILPLSDMQGRQRGRARVRA